MEMEDDGGARKPPPDLRPTTEPPLPLSETAGAASGIGSSSNPATGKGIVCAPGRRPSQRGILVAMQRSNNAISSLLQARMVLSVLNLPQGMIRRSSSLVHGAMGLAEDALGALGGLAKSTTAALPLAWAGGGAGRYLDGRPPVVRTYAGSMEAMVFVRSFDIEYGHSRPNFEKASFVETMSKAVREFKTLCSDPVVQFVNANFISWGADVRSSEGFQMSVCLRASTFPFCAVIAASSAQHLAVLHQVNGEKSAEDLLAVLRQVLEERGGAQLVARFEHAEIGRQRRLRDAEANRALLQERTRRKSQSQPAKEATDKGNAEKAVARRRRWLFFRS